MDFNITIQGTLYVDETLNIRHHPNGIKEVYPKADGNEFYEKECWEVSWFAFTEEIFGTRQEALDALPDVALSIHGLDPNNGIELDVDVQEAPN